LRSSVKVILTPWVYWIKVSLMERRYRIQIVFMRLFGLKQDFLAVFKKVGACDTGAVEEEML
jgi:hypothetical protein